MHTLVGGGGALRGTGTGPDLANLLKPALARGSLRCIAATTLGGHLSPPVRLRSSLLSNLC